MFKTSMKTIPVCAIMFALLATGISSGVNSTTSQNSPVISVVAAQLWKKMVVSEKTPAVLNGVSPDAVPFTYKNMLPMAYLDGKEFHGKLPDAVWLKLEQPGVAVVIIETDSGPFIKVLEDVSPGFVSKCQLGSGFGTLQGEPADLEPSQLKIKALWVVQDARVDAGETPGWFAIPPRQGQDLQLQQQNQIQLTDLH